MSPCLDKQELNFKEKNLWAVVKHLEKRVEQVPGGGSIKDAINNPLWHIGKAWNNMTKSEKRRMAVDWLTGVYEYGGSNNIYTSNKLNSTVHDAKYDESFNMILTLADKYKQGIDVKSIKGYKSAKEWLSNNPEIIDEWVAAAEKGYETGEAQKFDVL